MFLFIVLLAFVLLAAGLAWYFIANDKGEREPIGALWLAFGFGFAGGIAAAVIEGFIIPVKDLTPPSALGTIFVASMAIGIIEETCKFIPLAIFIYPKRYFNEHTDGIIYFALAGLGFGLPENILYTVNFGAGTGLQRIFLTPFFHAAITGMVGYFLVKIKLAHKSPLYAGLILLLAMVLHGLYDFGLASGLVVLSLVSIVFTLGMSVLLFVLYTRATELDQKVGMSAVGHNTFCRSCGQPNSGHLLYCTHCGQRA